MKFFVAKTDEVGAGWNKLIRLASWHSLFTKFVSDDQITEGDRGEKCGTFGENEHVWRNFD
jgi:hypothetical protein